MRCLIGIQMVASVPFLAEVKLCKFLYGCEKVTGAFRGSIFLVDTQSDLVHEYAIYSGRIRGASSGSSQAYKIKSATA